MIIVSVLLLSAIDGRSEELARMEICNMGTGTVHKGNYSAETLRGRSTGDFARRTRQRIAYVNDHPRQREHVWNLVAKALRNLRYGGDWKEANRIEISGQPSLQITAAPKSAPSDFNRGYLLAVSNLMNLHGDDVMARDILNELGCDREEMEAMGFDDYDLVPLRRLFDDIEQRREANP